MREKNFRDLSVVTKRDGKRILLRIIEETQLVSGKVSVRQIRKMKEKIINEGYDGGVLVGSGFSYSAKKEAKAEGIETVSYTHLTLPTKA